jgi:hypothetical protein
MPPGASCLCTGAEMRFLDSPECQCGCQDADAKYAIEHDPRKCPKCGGVRSSPADACPCGYHPPPPLRGTEPQRRLRPRPLADSCQGVIPLDVAYRRLQEWEARWGDDA